MLITKQYNLAEKPAKRCVMVIFVSLQKKYNLFKI